MLSSSTVNEVVIELNNNKNLDKEVTQELNQDSTQEVIQKLTQEVTQESIQEVIQEPIQEVIQESTQENIQSQQAVSNISVSCYSGVISSSLSPKTTRKLYEQKSKTALFIILFFDKYRTELEITKNVFKYFFKLYKVIAGCFLTIFTVQACDILTNKINCFESFFEWFVLGFNTLTFIFFMILNGIEIHREAYFIKQLQKYNKHESIEQHLYDYDQYEYDTNNNNLLKEISTWNNKQYYITLLSLILFILNFILSSVFMFSNPFENYKGTKTITTLLSNSFLLGYDLTNSLLVVKETIYSKYVVALSTYNTERLNYTGVNIQTRYLNEKDGHGQRNKDKRLISKVNRYYSIIKQIKTYKK